MIEKLIHQIWISPQEEIPVMCRELAETWAYFNPDFKYILWTRQKIQQMPEFRSMKVQQALKNCCYEIQKIDFLKYLILETFGGIYVDIDFECVKPLSGLLLDHECYLVEEQSDPLVLGNAFIGCKKNSKFTNYIVNSCYHNILNPSFDKADKLNYILNTAGPGFITSTYEQYHNRSEICIVPAKYLSPITAMESREIFRTKTISPDIKLKIKEAYGVHYFFSMWLNVEENNFEL